MKFVMDICFAAMASARSVVPMGDLGVESWIAVAVVKGCIQIAESERWILSGDVVRTGACPKCHAREAFSIHTKQDRWKCRICNARGDDSISLMAHMFDIDHAQAVGWLAKLDPPGGISEAMLRERFPINPVDPRVVELRRVA